MFAAGQCGARNHRAHTHIAAHRIYGDTRQTHQPSPRKRTTIPFESDGIDSNRARSALDCARNDCTPIVMAARRAQIMRPLQFTAIAAFVEGFHFQRIVAAAHAPARGRCFSFGDSHFGTCSC
jgi:hypothetical protein